MAGTRGPDCHPLSLASLSAVPTSGAELPRTQFQVLGVGGICLKKLIYQYQGPLRPVCEHEATTTSPAQGHEGQRGSEIVGGRLAVQASALTGLPELMAFPTTPGQFFQDYKPSWNIFHLHSALRGLM